MLHDCLALLSLVSLPHHVMSMVPLSPITGRFLSPCCSTSMSAPDLFGMLLIQDRGMDPGERVKGGLISECLQAGALAVIFHFHSFPFSTLASWKDFGTSPHSAESSRLASDSQRKCPRHCHACIAAMLTTHDNTQEASVHLHL